MSSIRILIVDNHPLLRGGVRRVCEIEPALELLGETSDGLQAVELAHELRPDVVLIDIDLPNLDGMCATRAIIAQSPATRVIVLTFHQDEPYVFAAIQAGVQGYLLKDIEERTLVAAIHAVYGGHVLFDARVAASLLRSVVAASPAAPAPPQRENPLSLKEMAALRLAAAGQDNKSIARQLNLSERTITNYLNTIYGKLQVDSRVQAVLYALREGWATLNQEG